MKDSVKNFKKVGMVGIGLCALCCALPILGVMMGVGSLTLLSRYFEWAGIGALVIALGSLGWAYYQRKKAPSCDLDCGGNSNVKESTTRTFDA